MSFIKETKEAICIGIVVVFGVLLVSEGIFSAGLLGAFALAGVAGLSLLAGIVAHLLGKKSFGKGFFATALVLSPGVLLHVAAVRGNSALASSRLETVIAAAESYKAKYGKSPASLKVLAPEFIAKIPRAKYTLMWGGFHIADNKIMFVSPMVFMTFGYDMASGKRACTGFDGLVSILRHKTNDSHRSPPVKH